MRLSRTTVEYAPVAQYDGTVESIQEIAEILPHGWEVRITHEGLVLVKPGYTITRNVPTNWGVAVIDKPGPIVVRPDPETGRPPAQIEGWSVEEVPEP